MQLLAGDTRETLPAAARRATLRPPHGRALDVTVAAPSVRTLAVRPAGIRRQQAAALGLGPPALHLRAHARPDQGRARAARDEPRVLDAVRDRADRRGRVLGAQGVRLSQGARAGPVRVPATARRPRLRAHGPDHGVRRERAGYA